MEGMDGGNGAEEEGGANSESEGDDDVEENTGGMDDF